MLIRELKYKERIVIILYYLCGFTTKQIGKILRIPESTVKTRMNRARRKLKNTFKGGADYERNRQ